jgi:hypothetical protein
MKAEGAPIETTERRLRSIENHFRREAVAPTISPCRIGVRVFGIHPDGQVYCCADFEPLGDITRQSARAIWTGAVARDIRRRTVACTKGCSYGCRESKSVADTIRRGLMIFGVTRGRDKGARTPTRSGASQGGPGLPVNALPVIETEPWPVEPIEPSPLSLEVIDPGQLAATHPVRGGAVPALAPDVAPAAISGKPPTP